MKTALNLCPLKCAHGFLRFDLMTHFLTFDIYRQGQVTTDRNFGAISMTVPNMYHIHRMVLKI